ncbi:MAG: response regulator [Syntrophobacteraceae bacterium]
MSAYSILVVEDEAVVAMDIEERLSALGYEHAGHADSGERALALAEHGRPDLVLMDIHLDGKLDGIEVAETMRRRFRVPVVFLTAYTDDATLERAKAVDPFGFVLKPFDDRDLKSAIEMAIHKHQSSEEIRRLNSLYDVLSQVNQTVVRVKTRDELLSTACRIVVERGQTDLAWIGWLDSSDSKIVPIARFGERLDIVSALDCYADECSEGPGSSGRAMREGRSVVCRECRGEDCLYPAGRSPSRYGFRSCGSFPLRFQGSVCGTLNVCVTEPGFFRERELQLLEEVAFDISFALDKIEDDARRERAEKTLRESEELFRSIFDMAAVGIAQADPRTGHWLRVNDRLSAITGYTSDELVRMSFLDLTHPEDRQRDWNAFQKVVRGDAPHYRNEKRYVRKDGEIVWVNVNVSVLGSDNGSPGYSLAVIEDITERKGLEQDRAHIEAQLRQAQKMEALGTLSGGIAHDFNNILGIIFGYAEMAHADLDDRERLEEDLHAVLSAAHRARALVQQILAFSRMNEQERQPVQIGLIVKEALKMIRASLPSTIEIKQHIASKDVVLADPTQIHQVLMNLCTNAAHAMRESGGTLRVGLTLVRLEKDASRLHAGPGAGPYLKLTAEDTGHGIDPAILDRIFEPFFTTKEKEDGTGLGLSVVHGIVKSHGGAIEVESHPGQGTAFHVYFPALESASEQRTLMDEPLPRGHERILLVDDEPALASVTAKMLERLGYRVAYRTSGIEALEAFRQQSEADPFRLVITDMTMPHLTGLELARELLKCHPDLPILICTGFSENVDPDKAKRLGIRGFLMKPVVVRDLAVKVREVLDRQA